MGCTQSKIENEEAVSRCKNRKQFMKDSVAARNAFAAAHSAYAMSLKNTGAALSDYAYGEVPPTSTVTGGASSSATSANIHSSSSAAVENLPPPPPLPSFAEITPLQRAITMPELKIQKSPDRKPTVVQPIIEEEGEESDSHESEKLVRKQSTRGGSGSSRGDHEVEQQMQPPRRREETRRSQPQQMMQEDFLDYLFPSIDSIRGSTLSNPITNQFKDELDEVKRHDVETDAFHETRNIVEDEEEMEKVANLSVQEVQDKPMEVIPFVPVSVMDKNAVKKIGGGVRRVGKAMNFMQIFLSLDDHFLKASESAHEVSKMLEATRLHYHSNFADNRGYIDHSARVMRVITWNRSFRGIPSVDDMTGDFDSEEQETHATVLDKMLAWEKKLFDEVKAGEIMKFEYQKKVATFNKLKKRNPNSESLQKLKAAVSHLHTKYIVDMQSIDSTVSEIDGLRDKQLYPKLFQLVDRMATMWESMRVQHEAQSKIINALGYLDISQSPKETSKHHHEQTFQLWVIVQEWHLQFCKLIDNQKAYIKSLNNWLKLNLIPIESSLKEKVSSPLRILNPPIRKLLIAWQDDLDRLPNEIARSAINNFAATVNTIFQHQEEELKLKEKCELTRKELTRKTRQFEDWYNKYIQQRAPEELDPEREDNTHKDAIAERQSVVDSLKRQLQEEEEAYQKQCLQVQEKSLASLKARLPDLFRALCDLCFACSQMYRNLRSISQQAIPK